MFLNKRLREADKTIESDAIAFDAASDEPSAINVGITSRDQLFSSYGYSGDKLNTEFSEYVFDKAKDLPVGEDVRINIHTEESIDAAEVTQALKRHYRMQYKQAKKEFKRMTWISAVMTALGIIALTALILINHFTDNLYITSIVEIAAWVFIWEAVDYFFLQRPVVKAKCILIQRIYAAEIEIK